MLFVLSITSISLLSILLKMKAINVKQAKYSMKNREKNKRPRTSCNSRHINEFFGNTFPIMYESFSMWLGLLAHSTEPGH